MMEILLNRNDDPFSKNVVLLSSGYTFINKGIVINFIHFILF